MEVTSNVENWVNFGQLPAEVILKAWHDASFAEKLKSDPTAALKSEGYSVPKNLSVSIHDNSETSVNFVLPAPLPELADMSELTEVASTKCCASGTCS